VMFSRTCVEAIRQHAMQKYPQEMCGFVIDDEFVPVDNIHETPETDFRMSDEVVFNGMLEKSSAIVHSHPNNNHYPTGRDIQGQISTGKTWGLVCTSEDRCTDPLWWGPGVNIPPIIGRSFRNGPSGSDGMGDCYALIKDWYKLERNIDLMDFPRDLEWWLRGENLYLENFGKAGFKIVTIPEPGDVFIAQVVGKYPSHAGILIDPGTIVHHLSNRLSRRENVMPWRKYVHHWVRYNP